MVDIIYTTVFRVKMLNKVTLGIRLFNGLTRGNRGIDITYVSYVLYKYA